jgi:glycosyltransferase involved in cell wall biosynthesis
MFGWEFPPHNSGGLGVACRGLVRALSRDTEGIKLIFVLPRKQEVAGDGAHFLFADDYARNIKVRVVDSVLSPYLNTKTYNDYFRLLSSGEKNFYGSSLFAEVDGYARRAEVIARQEEFDVIHAHDWLSFPAGIRAKELTGKPLVVHVHATEFDRTGGNGVHGHVYEIERRGMEIADKVISVSEFTKRVIVDKYRIPSEKVEVVHNGIETDSGRLSSANERTSLHALKDSGMNIVLFVGRITLQKGLEYLLYAAKRVIEHRPNTLFVIAGSGDMIEQMMRLTADLSISKNVLYAGFLRGEELDYAYAAADLFVMPSVSEPFGLTALEAIKNGTPVILSKQSGVSEVVNHALRVDFWDSEAMADKIISVLSHQSLRTELRINAQRELSRVSWSSAANKCRAIYSMLVGKNIPAM